MLHEDQAMGMHKHPDVQLSMSFMSSWKHYFEGVAGVPHDERFVRLLRAEPIVCLNLTGMHATTEQCCALHGVRWHSHSLQLCPGRHSLQVCPGRHLLQVCPGRQHQGSEWCATEPGRGAVVASSEHIALLAEQQKSRKVLAAVVDESSGEAGSRDGVGQHLGPGGLRDELLAAGLPRRMHHEGVGQLCIIGQLHPCSRIRRIFELALSPLRGWAVAGQHCPYHTLKPSDQSGPAPHDTFRQTQAAQKFGNPRT